MDITVITPILSVLIAAAALYFSRRKSAQEDTAQMTEAIMKIEVIGQNVADVKADVKAIRNEMREDHDKIVDMERQVKTMWQRIDELKELVKR